MVLTQQSAVPESQVINLPTAVEASPQAEDAQNFYTDSANDLNASHLFSESCLRLPIKLNIAIPVREFRIRSLLALEVGRIIETQWPHGEDMPVLSADVQLAWSEFEVVDAKLAVRLTRLA